jgi:hypothetical protein
MDAMDTRHSNTLQIQHREQTRKFAELEEMIKTHAQYLPAAPTQVNHAPGALWKKAKATTGDAATPDAKVWDEAEQAWGDVTKYTEDGPPGDTA